MRVAPEPQDRPYGEVAASLAQAGVRCGWQDRNGDLGASDALTLRPTTRADLARTLPVLQAFGYRIVPGNGVELRFVSPERPFEDLLVELEPGAD